MKEQIIIAGAGLSGLSAAYTLAKSGLDVLVYEKKSSPGHDKHPYSCAVKSVNGLNVLQEFASFDISIKTYEINPRVIKYSPNNQKNVGFKHYYLIGMGQSEHSLENQLYLKCLSENVKFKFNSPSQEADIIATGPKIPLVNIHGYGTVFSHMKVDPEATYLIYNNDIAPKGYTYISTKNALTTVMAVSFDPPTFIKMKEKFHKALHEFRPLKEMTTGATKKSEIYGSAFYRKDPYPYLEKNGKLYVGEAAGLQDAARGFGIRGVLS